MSFFQSGGFGDGGFWKPPSGSSPPAPQYPLDLVAGATAAHGHLRLSSAWAGSAIQARRSSDDTTQDIGFSDADLNTASLLSFVGANDGFDSAVYDQSGNGNHLVQGVNAEQPMNVSSGSLTTFNSKSVATFSGAQYLASMSGVLNQPYTVIAVASVNDASVFDGMIVGNTNVNGNMWVESNNVYTYDGSDANGTQTVLSDTAYVLTIVHNGASSVIAVNGTRETVDPGTDGRSDLLWGAYADGAVQGFLNGKIAASLLYPSALSNGDCLQLEQYFGSYYGIVIA